MKPIITFALLLLSATSFGQSPKVAYAVSVCQPGTNSKLTAMKVGQSFDLVLTVQDLRPSGTWVNDSGQSKPLVRGVFAAYCDVRYDKSLAKVTYYSSGSLFAGCFTFSPQFPNGHAAADADDRINNIGAFASSFGANTQPVEVWRVRMTTKAAGPLVFAPDVSDVPHPQQDTLVYGNDLASPPELSYVAMSDVVLIPCAVTVSK